MVAAPLPPIQPSLMERARPTGMPGSQQLRIPTPQDLERMRKMRQQHQQRVQRQLAVPPPAPRAPPAGMPQRQQQQSTQEPAQPREWAPAPSQLPAGMPQRTTQAALGMLQRQQQGAAPPRQQQQQQQQQTQQQTRAAPSRGLQRPPPGQQRRPPSRGPDIFDALAEQCDLEEGWRPQVLLLHELGLRAPDFQRLVDSRQEIFLMGIVTMRKKLQFLRDAIGLSEAELTKVIAKFPRILEYKSERTIRPRLDFLKAHGVAAEDLAKVIVRAPMVLELKVKETLAPRAAYLRKTLRLPAESLGKLIVRHPQVLTCTEDMMQQRVDYLLAQGLSLEEVGRAVLAHPQVLHYKLDSMGERLAYLRSIGVEAAAAGACIARFPQLFSLNVEGNLAPKWAYLCDYILIAAPKEARVATLCAYPAYLSLSLTNRIVPRHRYYLHTQAARGEPGTTTSFPMNALKVSDASFVKLCGSSLEEYEAFKAQLFGGAAPPPAVGRPQGAASLAGSLDEEDTGDA